MYGNGAAIGMGRIITKAVPHQIPKAHHRGRAACTAAVAGGTLPRIAVWRTAAPALQTSATTA